MIVRAQSPPRADFIPTGRDAVQWLISKNKQALEEINDAPPLNYNFSAKKQHMLLFDFQQQHKVEFHHDHAVGNPLANFLLRGGASAAKVLLIQQRIFRAVSLFRFSYLSQQLL